MNKIHPTVIVEGDVVFGKGNEILPYTVLIGPLRIGDNNIIGPHVVIGTPGEDTRNPRHDASQKLIEIGNNNTIREGCVIQKPCYGEITKIHNDVYLMHGVHVPHDAIIEDNVVSAPLVVVAGISKILKGANLGMSCTIHQYSVVGQYSIVATGAAAVKNVKPFSRFIPNKPISVNTYAIQKYGFVEYTDEISKYVLENKKPTSTRILSIVDRYESLHRDSGRQQY